MKKFIVILFLLLITNSCYAFNGNIEQYINQPYIGIPYEKALQQELPFILMFVNPNQLVYFPKYLNIGEMVYNEFNGQYNFCIINAKKKENKPLINAYNIKKYPVLILVNTQRQTYITVDKKDFNKKELRKILVDFKNRT